MSQSSGTCTSSGDEYHGADGDIGFESAGNSSVSTSVNEVAETSQPAKMYPWKNRDNDDLDEEAHRRLDDRLRERSGSRNRLAKDPYKASTKKAIKAIQKQNRNMSGSANSSKIASPEDNPLASPFTFNQQNSSSGVSLVANGNGLANGNGGQNGNGKHRYKKLGKKRNKARSYDRDLKLLGAERDHGPHISSQDSGVPKPAIEVETCTRFLSLQSRPVEKVDGFKEPEKTPGFRRQSLSRSISKWPNCPKDRIKFYDSFSVLIELGSKAKKSKEEQLRKNMVAETVPEKWRNEVSDVVWLELQGWMHNRDMHFQDQWLMTERERIDGILQRVKDFSIDDTRVCVPCSSCRDSFADVDDDYLSALAYAFRLVTDVLQELESVEQLYPCTKKIGPSHPVYDLVAFQDKVKALVMWINFYMQLSYRLQAVACIVSGRKNPPPVFPLLSTKLEDDREDTPLEIHGDVVDGGSHLDVSPRSGLSSRNSSLVDLNRLDSSASSGYSGSLQGVLRQYLEKGLHTRGLEKTIKQIKNLILPTLRHILKNLSEPVPGSRLNRQMSNPEGHVENVDIVKLWCDLHQESNLPCLDRIFGFLLRLPVKTLQEGIRIRIEQRPNPELEIDLPSLNQLIHECKDTLVMSMETRDDYVNLGRTIRHHNIMLGEIGVLDDLMKKLLELYLDYLRKWILTLQKEPKASRLQKTILEDEWKFVTSLCGSIENAELELPKQFCSIVQGLLTGIGSLLDNGLDDFISTLYVPLDGQNGLSPSRDAFRQFSRDCKAVFIEARERCFKLLEFTKLLYKDLEIAAIYDIIPSLSSFLDLLAESNHFAVELMFTQDEFYSGKLRFFVSPSASNNESQVTKLLNVTLGARDQLTDWAGYLLIIPACNETWRGQTVRIDAGALTAIRHCHVSLTTGKVMLVVLRNSVLNTQSKTFERLLPKDTVKCDVSQTTCNDLITNDLETIKEESLELGKKICQVMTRLQREFAVEQFPEVAEPDRNVMVKASRELLMLCYAFCIEYHREIARLTFTDEEGLARQLINLAFQWMDFVIYKCERGNGTRPRWSTPGLDYLTVAVRPCYTQYLSDQQFQELKNKIDLCVTHLIGEAPSPQTGKTPTESPTTFYLSPPQSTHSFSRDNRLSFSSSSEGHLLPTRMSSKTDTTASFETSDEEDTEPYDSQHRVEDAIEKLEKNRDDKLLRAKIIGKIVPIDLKKSERHLGPRKVDFRWRMCAKVGSGRHADVYKAMNLDTGGLVAVKKFQVEQANFDEKVAKVANEIEWLATLQHPNVVKYFGVELKRNELMLFMEYCDGGTLSDLARQGLDILMVRVYTRQLLLGISYLHDNGICHLDIKGQNIFLTSAGIVKLGDFSEMVKLENGSTRTNEITGNVGTPRFMSPEMIRGEQSSKIGRSSDIWSLGCVVVEMITGKTPKFDKDDNDFAIMFYVSSGGHPKIPENINQDARDFLDHCFEKEAEKRWKAGKLLSHSFVTVELAE